MREGGGKGEGDGAVEIEIVLLTHVFVLDVPSWLPLQLCGVQALGGEILDEHLLKKGGFST